RALLPIPLLARRLPILVPALLLLAVFALSLLLLRLLLAPAFDLLFHQLLVVPRVLVSRFAAQHFLPGRDRLFQPAGAREGIAQVVERLRILRAPQRLGSAFVILRAIPRRALPGGILEQPRCPVRVTFPERPHRLLVRPEPQVLPFEGVRIVRR